MLLELQLVHVAHLHTLLDHEAVGSEAEHLQRTRAACPDDHVAHGGVGELGLLLADVPRATGEDAHVASRQLEYRAQERRLELVATETLHMCTRRAAGCKRVECGRLVGRGRGGIGARALSLASGG